MKNNAETKVEIKGAAVLKREVLSKIDSVLMSHGKTNLISKSVIEDLRGDIANL